MLLEGRTPGRVVTLRFAGGILLSLGLGTAACESSPLPRAPSVSEAPPSHDAGTARDKAFCAAFQTYVDALASSFDALKGEEVSTPMSRLWTPKTLIPGAKGGVDSSDRRRSGGKPQVLRSGPS